MTQVSPVFAVHVCWNNWYFLFKNLRSCVRDPSESIAARLKDMSEIFLHNYEGTGEESKNLARGVHLMLSYVIYS